MEAFLLTLDVIAIILLARGVRNAVRTGNPQSLGVFGYANRAGKAGRRKSHRDGDPPNA